MTYEPIFEIPTASPTSTPVVCDPFSTDFCITEGSFIFRRPIRQPANTFIDTTYPYASTSNGQRDPHHGVEFLNKFGTPVYAAGDGRVIFAGPDHEAVYSPWPDYYGNVVVIQHDDDLYTLYAHLSRITVQTNALIAAGEKIGEVGQSGVAIGPHLHFEVRRGDVTNYYLTRNPELWLMPNQGSNRQLGVIQIFIRDQTGQPVKLAKFTLEYFDKKQTRRKTYYGITYSADMLNGDENAVMGDMPHGEYRIAFKYEGQLYERRVEVKSGKLTQVVFTVK